jgi:hypothetical protein
MIPVVPDVKPVNIPPLLIVATDGLVTDHIPPGIESYRATDEPKQTDEGA